MATADNEQSKETVIPQDPTIEELAVSLGIKAWVMAGVMKEMNWAQGKRLPEAEFKAAVKTWLKSPMKGTKKEKEGKDGAAS